MCNQLQAGPRARAMAAYARQAKDSELIQYATEIKVRAERRCGELLARTAETGERATSTGNVNQHTMRVSNDAPPTRPTLADMGLTRDESSRYQKLAAMPAEHFETAVATAKATGCTPPRSSAAQACVRCRRGWSPQRRHSGCWPSQAAISRLAS